MIIIYTMRNKNQKVAESSLVLQNVAMKLKSLVCKKLYECDNDNAAIPTVCQSNMQLVSV